MKDIVILRRQECSCASWFPSIIRWSSSDFVLMVMDSVQWEVCLYLPLLIDIQTLIFFRPFIVVNICWIFVLFYSIASASDYLWCQQILWCKHAWSEARIRFDWGWTSRTRRRGRGVHLYENKWDQSHLCIWFPISIENTLLDKRCQAHPRPST